MSISFLKLYQFYHCYFLAKSVSWIRTLLHKRTHTQTNDFIGDSEYLRNLRSHTKITTSQLATKSDWVCHVSPVFLGTHDVLYTNKRVHSLWKPGYTWQTQPDLDILQCSWLLNRSIKICLVYLMYRVIHPCTHN